MELLLDTLKSVLQDLSWVWSRTVSPPGPLTSGGRGTENGGGTTGSRQPDERERSGVGPVVDNCPGPPS